ncbi:hypothetical protein V2A60_000622 [Cordyceps javanica]
MASLSVPSSCFTRRTAIWKQLALRSDVDDIILELLGRFSLEKLYLVDGEKTRYQTIMINLLIQLDAIFYIQRLTIPSRQSQPGPFLGFLVSWEIAARTVELVLQTIVEARDNLWEATALRDEYLAEFLLGALRVLQLHPRSPPLQRPKDRRARFARIHRLLEQIFDAYPGPKSFLLIMCKEITGRLHEDAHSLCLPPKMQQTAPNLTTELFPLTTCLQPPSILELVSAETASTSWLSQFMALRDISQYIIGVSLQNAARFETCDRQLRQSSLASRNAVFEALQDLQIPAQFSKADVVASFNAYFRLILWDTPELSTLGFDEPKKGEYIADALDELSEKLSQRQAIHRTSDRETSSNISRIMKSIQIQDDPEGNYMGSQSPSQYVFNCPNSHTVGGAQLRAGGINTALESVHLQEIRLPELATCVTCDKGVTVARELPLARKVWELLSPLQVNADAVNVERHMSNSFQFGSPDTEPHDLFSYSTFTAGLGGDVAATLDSDILPTQTNPCKNCASVDTLAFSQDGLSLVASTRSGKGVVQIYLWRFPFDSYEELAGCRYPVPMHESEDNGISSVMMRSQQGAEEGLICVTTWTQSGTPVLIQQSDGHRTEVKPASSTIHGKLGNRIKSAAFSASGRELALVNDKGHLYLVSNLNAMPIDIRRKATSRELTSKNCALVLSFMTLASEEAAVMLWVDPSRGKAFMRKTFVGTRSSTSILETNGPVYVSSAPSRRGPHAGNLTPRSEIADTQELGARTPRERSKGTPRKQLKLFE